MFGFGRPHSDLQRWTTLVLTCASVCPQKRQRAYLLPVCHPVSDGGNQDGAQQDLGGVVDQERDRNQREVLVALKHDFQHRDTWTERKYLCLQFYRKKTEKNIEGKSPHIIVNFCLSNV